MVAKMEKRSIFLANFFPISHSQNHKTPANERKTDESLRQSSNEMRELRQQEYVANKIYERNRVSKRKDNT